MVRECAALTALLGIMANDTQVCIIYKFKKKLRNSSVLSEASENKGLTSRSFWILGLIPMVEGWKGDVGDCNGPPETNLASE